MVINHFKINKRKFLFLFIFLLFFLTTGCFKIVKATEAASIYFSPDQGNYQQGDSFSVDLIIDGNGQDFNAAKANVDISNNLFVENLTLGNCDFAFVITPNPQNLSFVGVILGGASKKCVLYKLDLKINGDGEAKIIIPNASVKSYQRSTEILTTFKGASYNIKTSSNIKTSMPTPITTQENMSEPESYSVTLTIKDSHEKPVGGADVTLSHQTLDENKNAKEVYTQITNSKGLVEFINLEKGLYKMSAEHEGKILAEKVFNIEGTNPVITLGINKETEELNMNLILISSFVVFIIIITIVIYFIHRNRSENYLAEI